VSRATSARWRPRPAAALAPLVLVLAMGGCASASSAPSAPASGPRSVPGAAPPGPLPAHCTAHVTDPVALRRAVAVAAPGDRVCVTGDLGATRLAITRSGTPQRPIEVIGDGNTTIAGITINADQVRVRGFRMLHAYAPAIWMKGTGITVEDNTVRHPTGDDFDGIRFFGTDLKILHNTITDIAPDDSQAHADCMQSFATGTNSVTPNTGPTQHVLIDGNRCEHIDNQCLIVEGPFSSAGDGSRASVTTDIRYTNNYCEAHASQAVWLDDVRNAVLENNEIDGSMVKAFGVANNSSGATVGGNKISPDIDNEISMDDSSTFNYHGPTPHGSP
jgi:parallel beta helix pectate lyase-like protein